MSLSHYCPSAAALLFADHRTLTLVQAPAAFPSSWPFEGLDVRGHFPPFLRPGVLLGFDGLHALESEIVAAMDRGPSAAAALARVQAALEQIAAWTPGSLSVPELIRRAFGVAEALDAPAAIVADPVPVLMASLTRGAEAPPVLPPWRGATEKLAPGGRCDLALRRYLAARAFGNWIVFHAEDVRVLGRYLGLALGAVLLFAADRPEADDESSRWMEAVRSADLWLMHHCDPELVALNLR